VARRLALAAGSLLAGLLAAEILLRVFPIEPPGRIHWTGEGRFVRRDPGLIWRLAPNARHVWTTDEFREERRTNSLGMRDDEVEPRGAGERRILALGDSFTFGHGVAAEEAYPEVLAALLSSGDRPVTVLNAGVPGYGIDQVLRALPERLAQTDPDLVLVGIHCSDVDEGWLWPLYALRDGALAPLPAWRTGVWLQGLVVDATPRWLRSSALFQQVARRLPARDPFFQRPSLGREELRAWARDKIVAELRAIAGAARARGAAVAAVLMPCKEDLGGAPGLPYRDLGARIEAAGVPALAAADALRAARGGDLRELFFVRDVHLNAAGNRALAGAVARFLEARALLDPMPRAHRRADRRPHP
jgi:lysophospholipase L1-like esterase